MWWKLRKGDGKKVTRMFFFLKPAEGPEEGLLDVRDIREDEWAMIFFGVVGKGLPASSESTLLSSFPTQEHFPYPHTLSCRTLGRWRTRATSRLYIKTALGGRESESNISGVTGKSGSSVACVPPETPFDCSPSRVFRTLEQFRQRPCLPGVPKEPLSLCHCWGYRAECSRSLGFYERSYDVSGGFLEGFKDLMRWLTNY